MSLNALLSNCLHLKFWIYHKLKHGWNIRNVYHHFQWEFWRINHYLLNMTLYNYRNYVINRKYKCYILLMLFKIIKKCTHTLTTTFQSKIRRKNPTARGFLFLNLPKITKIIFFCWKCGHKRRLSDGYSHNRRIRDGALVVSVA